MPNWINLALHSILYSCPQICGQMEARVRAPPSQFGCVLGMLGWHMSDIYCTLCTQFSLSRVLIFFVLVEFIFMPCFSNLIICVHVLMMCVTLLVLIVSRINLVVHIHFHCDFVPRMNEVKGSLMQIYYWMIYLLVHLSSLYSHTTHQLTTLPSMLSLWCKPFCRKNPCWAKTHIIIIYCYWILHYGIQEFPSLIDEALFQVVFHTVALPLTLKSILRQRRIMETQIFHHAKL